MLDYKKQISDLARSKPKDKAVDLFWKLYPKNRNYKSWVSALAEADYKPALKSGKE